MGVVWGAEGAQECQVLLKLGQGRTVSKGLLDLARISVLGSHSHHLRDIEHARERGPPDPRARRWVTGGHIMHSAAAHCQGRRSHMPIRRSFLPQDQDERFYWRSSSPAAALRALPLEVRQAGRLYGSMST
jgi:hypothetical protein